MEAASNVGSNCSAMDVTACTIPSTFSPITLMGKRLGYSISESVRGFSGRGLGLVMPEIILLLVRENKNVWVITYNGGLYSEQADVTWA